MACNIFVLLSPGFVQHVSGFLSFATSSVDCESRTSSFYTVLETQSEELIFFFLQVDLIMKAQLLIFYLHGHANYFGKRHVLAEWKVSGLYYFSRSVCV